MRAFSLTVCGAADQALHLVRRAAADGLLQADEVATEDRSRVRGTHQGYDRGEPILRLSHGRLVAGLQQEHCAADLPAEGLAGAQTACWGQTTDRSAAFGR